MAIRSLPSIPALVLEGPASPHLGDIYFVELHTTLKMHAMSITCFKRLITDGSFKAEGDYSYMMSILLTFIPNAKLMGIEKVGIGLIVCWCGGSLADIVSVQKFIEEIHNHLKKERQLNMLMPQMYVMLVGNYGRHMAFTTDQPLCLEKPMEYYNTKDLSIMMIPKSRQPSSCIDGE